MIAGAIAGLVVQYSGLPAETIAVLVRWIKPVGEIFLRMIFMMVIPLIFSALALGIAELGDLRKIGRVGLRTLYFTVLVSVISVIIGISFVQIFQPGESIGEADREMLMERFTGNAGTLQQTVSQVKTRGLAEIIVSLVPRNPLEDMMNAFNPGYSGGGLLAVMFFSLMVGAAMAISERDKVAGFRAFLEGLYEIVMKVIGFGMKLAPYGVASLLFGLTATMGWSILAILSWFVLVVLSALAVHMFLVYSALLLLLTKTNPIGFFKNIREVIIVAFSTSSSNATESKRDRALRRRNRPVPRAVLRNRSYHVPADFCRIPRDSWWNRNSRCAERFSADHYADPDFNRHSR